MRKTAIITTSLPHSMVKKVNKAAKKQHMTRSELLRQALRQYFEWQDVDEAIRIAEEEKAAGKLKTLQEGGLATLMEEAHATN